VAVAVGVGAGLQQAVSAAAIAEVGVAVVAVFERIELTVAAVGGAIGAWAWVAGSRSAAGDEEGQNPEDSGSDPRDGCDCSGAAGSVVDQRLAVSEDQEKPPQPAVPGFV